jgi:hypothetical protein
MTSEFRSVKVGILTPYLSETCMAGPDTLSTPKRRIELLSPEYRDGKRSLIEDGLVRSIYPFDLAIAGSTEIGEEEVRSLKGSGLIVGRFSMFHGGPSGYSGLMPEEGGYSLDIPKRADIALRFLTDDAVLDALVARDERSIRSSIESLSRILPEPILVTPYLGETLRSGR